MLVPYFGIYPPGCNRGHWRFIAGFATKIVKTSVVSGILGGGASQHIFLSLGRLGFYLPVQDANCRVSCFNSWVSKGTVDDSWQKPENSRNMSNNERQKKGEGIHHSGTFKLVKGSLVKGSFCGRSGIEFFLGFFTHVESSRRWGMFVWICFFVDLHDHLGS